MLLKAKKDCCWKWTLPTQARANRANPQSAYRLRQEISVPPSMHKATRFAVARFTVLRLLRCESSPGN